MLSMETFTQQMERFCRCWEFIQKQNELYKEYQDLGLSGEKPGGGILRWYIFDARCGRDTGQIERYLDALRREGVKRQFALGSPAELYDLVLFLRKQQEIHDLEDGSIIGIRSRAAEDGAGAPKLEYPVSRSLENEFVSGLYELGFDRYGVIIDDESFLFSENIRFDPEGGPYYDDGILTVRPYYWGDDDFLESLPNFVFKEDGLEISWYKYALRGAFSSRPLDSSYIRSVFDRILRKREEDPEPEAKGDLTCG